MPRRAKLIILAIVLVLLAIPSVQIYLHWRPENPLRFQMQERELADPSDPQTAFTTRLLVSNTSSTPIHLEYTDIQSESAEAGITRPVSWFGSTTEKEFIPPHGTLEMRASLFFPASDLPLAGDLQIEYTWKSHLRHQAAILHARYYDDFPMALRKKFSSIDSCHDISPLASASQK